MDARPSDAIALAVRTGSSIWMLEEVVAEASIAVDAEADAEDQSAFNRFVDDLSPAALVRHLEEARVSRSRTNHRRNETALRDGRAISLFTLGTDAPLGSIEQMETVLCAAVCAGINHLRPLRPMDRLNAFWGGQGGAEPSQKAAG